MNKNTTRLIVLAVLTLAVLNMLLIGMVWTKKSPDRSRGPRPIEEVNEFIIRELDFNAEQAQAFRELANDHHRIQRGNNEAFRQAKRDINQILIRKGSVDIDSASVKLAEITARKEKEFYQFMEKVLEICNEDQKRRLGRVFLEATGPPEHARMPFNEQVKPPPPPR